MKINSGIIKLVLSQLGLFGFFWLTCYGIAPKASFPWNGLVFGFLAIFAVSYIAGQFCKLISIPPLVGMLIAGICLSNLTSIPLNPSVSSFARNLALAVILLRAGVSLDPSALRKLSLVCLRLAFTPCIVEALVLAVGAHLSLHVPFMWSMVLGFVCVATSPAVIVPSMINIQDEGYGVDKGIPTLIMGGSSVDDIMAITGFEIFLSLVTSSSTSILATLAGPAEAIGGLVLGTGLGFLFWILPPTAIDPDDLEAKSHNGRIRFFFLLLSGVSFIFTTKTLGCDSMGPLGTLSMSFVAALRWRSEGYIDEITTKLRDLWFFCEIFLFSLIGYEVKFSSLQSTTVIWSLICLLIGMVSRTIVSFTVVMGAGLTIKERFFIAMAWLPKGTVQAAIGSIPLELARAKQDETQIQYGLTILTYAVLSIIITAPLGAYLISFFGPKLLVKSISDDGPDHARSTKNLHA